VDARLGEGAGDGGHTGLGGSNRWGRDASGRRGRIRAAAAGMVGREVVRERRCAGEGRQEADPRESWTKKHF
jgi:hypothetical protein